MEAEIPEPFRPSPTLRLFFPCEDAALNVPGSTGDLGQAWWEIRKPLYQVSMPPGIVKGFLLKDLTLYYQLTDGRGAYNLLVEVHLLDLLNPKRNRSVAWSEIYHAELADELEVLEDTVVMDVVPFPVPGLYRIRMNANGKVLAGGETFLRVFAGAVS